MRRKPIDLKLETMRALPGLDGCPYEDVVALGSRCDQLEATAGTALIHEGRAGRSAFIIVEGRVDVRRAGVLLWEAGRGSLVGDLGVLGALPTAATVVATSPLTYLSLDTHAADVLLGRVELARWAYGQLEQRLRQVTLAPTGYQPMAERFDVSLDRRVPVAV